MFAGGWTLEAAEAVGAGQEVAEWEVLDRHGQLIDKSLVVAETDSHGERRFRLLATIRQYAGERLRQAGEGEQVRDRHRNWFVALAEGAALHLTGGEPAATELTRAEQALWLDRLELEHDNMRAALEWSQAQEDDVEAGLRLAGFLFPFWYVRGYLMEGRHWLEAALARSAGTSAAARARALRGAGMLAGDQGDQQKATDLLEESLALYRGLDDQWGVARALLGLGILELRAGELNRAESFFDEALELGRAIGVPAIVRIVLNSLGEMARLRGDYATARAHYEEAVRAAGQVSGSARAPLLNLGMWLCSKATAPRHARASATASRRPPDSATERRLPWVWRGWRGSSRETVRSSVLHGCSGRRARCARRSMHPSSQSTWQSTSALSRRLGPLWARQPSARLGRRAKA